MNTAPDLSVASLVRPTDYTVTLTFTPAEPIAMTEVALCPDPGAAHDDLLALLGDALARLAFYRDSYAQARDADEDDLSDDDAEYDPWAAGCEWEPLPDDHREWEPSDEDFATDLDPLYL